MPSATCSVIVRLEDRQAVFGSQGSGSPLRNPMSASAPNSSFSRRNRPSVNCDRRMFSGIENCWRIDAIESVVADVAKLGSRSISAMGARKAFFTQVVGDRAADDSSPDDDDVVFQRSGLFFSARQ